MKETGRRSAERRLGISATGVLKRLTERASFFLMHRTFDFWQRLGFHFTRNHFYGPVPDTRALPDSLWTQHSELVGIDLQVEEQLDLIETFRRNFGAEYEALPRAEEGSAAHFYLENDLFGWMDAVIYYCIIRQWKPRRIVEVGSGLSTLLAATALDRNREEGIDGAITAIDPYPREYLRPMLEDKAELLTQEVQTVPLSRFTTLDRGDVLFIDSSHVLKIGSDVEFEYLEVIPRLKRGVLVHSHDIFLPAQYPEDWVKRQRRFWNEQYLLQAFLAFNSSFEVVWSGSFMHAAHSDVLNGAFGIYEPSHRPPGSFWFRRVS